MTKVSPPAPSVPPLTTIAAIGIGERVGGCVVGVPDDRVVAGATVQDIGSRTAGAIQPAGDCVVPTIAVDGVVTRQGVDDVIASGTVQRVVCGRCARKNGTGRCQLEIGLGDVAARYPVDLNGSDRGQAGVPDGDQGVGSLRRDTHTSGKVPRVDTQRAEVDQVLRRCGTAGGIEVGDDIGAETGGVVDKDVVASVIRQQVDRIIASTTDESVGIVADPA